LVDVARTDITTYLGSVKTGINSPHNPTGKVFTREELQQIAVPTTRPGVRS
jgi:bifunctional pyridoxal-dependent enzyme with beta-cystathionase and maltose regulon repressor activities